MRLENHVYADIEVGQFAQLRRLITDDDLFVFAAASGNFNPAHLPHAESHAGPAPESVAPGMFAASVISAALGTQLPGPGTLYRSHQLAFVERAHAGDELIATVTVLSKQDPDLVTLATEVRRASDAALIAHGIAEVIAPRERFTADDVDMPGLVVQRHRHFDALIARAHQLPPLPTAVVCPEDTNSLGGALLATRERLMTPILIGNLNRIAAAADALGADLQGLEIIEATSAESASQCACALVHEGRVAAVMKGHMHTDDLLKPMLDRRSGLRVGRRFTHVFVMDVPGVPHPLMVTDAAINIAPDLATKVDIVQNAIDLARSLSDETPRVGVLSAVETVNAAIQSSVDAALLSKMAERGQIRGGDVDGPLAMDNAVSMAAARTKGLRSRVAGHANILVVPGLDAGNMLAKQLAFISHAEGAGLVLGARVPVILNSRSDSAMSRLASCAVASIHHARTQATSSAA